VDDPRMSLRVKPRLGLGQEPGPVPPERAEPGQTP
jgi:hypothetical protein